VVRRQGEGSARTTAGPLQTDNKKANLARINRLSGGCVPTAQTQGDGMTWRMYDFATDHAIQLERKPTCKEPKAPDDVDDLACTLCGTGDAEGAAGVF
jgi:hypothetical protein